MGRSGVHSPFSGWFWISLLWTKAKLCQTIVAWYSIHTLKLCCINNPVAFKLQWSSVSVNLTWIWATTSLYLAENCRLFTAKPTKLVGFCVVLRSTENKTNKRLCLYSFGLWVLEHPMGCGVTDCVSRTQLLCKTQMQENKETEHRDDCAWRKDWSEWLNESAEQGEQRGKLT